MEKEERIKMFVRFLKENNCYKQFMHNFLKSDLNDFMIINRTIDNLVHVIYEYKYSAFNEIGLAFRWNETEQREEYWINLSRKWYEILNYNGTK